MAAPTISWSDHEGVTSPDAMDVPRTFAATIGVNAKAAFVLITSAGGSIGDLTGLPDLGGLDFTEYADTAALSGVRRAWAFGLTDLSGRSDDVITVPIAAGAYWYNLCVGIIDHTGTVVVMDAGTDAGSGSSVTLDAGPDEARALMCASGGGTNFGQGAGQTQLWSEAFLTLYDSIGAHEAIGPGSEAVDFTGGGAGAVMAALAFGGTTDHLFEPPGGEFFAETGGAGLLLAGDSAFPAPGAGYGWETGGVSLDAQTDWQVRLASLDGIETPTETEGGATGEFLQRVEGDKPVWAEVAMDAGTGLVETSGSGAYTADRAVAATHDRTLTGDSTITPDHSAPTAGEAIDIRVLARQDGIGGHTLAFGGVILWATPGGVAPTIPSAANALLTLGFLSVDDAATWIGYVVDTSTPVLALDDLSDVALTAETEGDTLRHRSGEWVNEAFPTIPGAAQYVTVDPGTVTYDDAGEDVEVTVETVWGFDGADAYYDSAGAVAGEEAALMYDPEERAYRVTPYDFPP